VKLVKPSFFYLVLTVWVIYAPTGSALQKPTTPYEAEQLYASHKQSIYQIRVIELATGNKATIGSGFIINNQGYIATNFHVVSTFVHQPKRYRLEYASVAGVTGPLQLLNIDVVHDLAITKSNITDAAPLTLGKSSLAKGTRIFSLGNPRDLGFSVVEGTYNGLLEKALFDKIFFSGSLNPGMSGGPTLDHNGQVIGINVSTAGNQLSFLVPVEYLRKLKHDTAPTETDEPANFQKLIEKQLTNHQSNFLSQLLKSKWKTTKLGPFTLPGSINDIFKCWGDSENETDALVDHAYSNCFSEDQIYLAQRFTTGGIAYTYDYIRSKNLSSVHFYNLYSTEYSRSIQVNSGKKEEMSNFECHTDFVTIAKKDWKMSLCARHYLKYPSLHDINIAMALVDEKEIGLIIQIAMSGVLRQSALDLTNKFIEHISWSK